MERKSGILMPVFSLPSEYGIGDFGKGCYQFIDYLKACGQKIWQILPLVQTGYGNSPYSSVSSKSFSPYYISPELLVKDGLLTKKEIEFSKCDKKYIDYGFLYAVRFPMLKKAFERFDKCDENFTKYVKSKKSYDYALFMALKYASGQKHFYEWADEYKRRDKSALRKFAKDYNEEILFWQFVQYIARKQWLDVKKYANLNGIEIMGDMPLYVALDSVDVWTNPQLFKLDDDFCPVKKAGVPPDYFCSEGQLWGNPVYDYEAHKKDGYNWWANRIKDALKICDYVRIDHFRGLDRFYEVDGNAENAISGEWIDVPSEELFSAIHKKVNPEKIVAEDLGIIDDGVRELLKHTGYPGMKILSFAFNGDKENLYLPENLPINCVCYTGTHDNDTLKSLIKNFNDWDFNNFKLGILNSLKTLKISRGVNTINGFINACIKLGMKSDAKWFIMPWQDVKKLGGEYRINEPGVVKGQNWSIKFTKADFDKKTANKLKELTKKYDR